MAFFAEYGTDMFVRQRYFPDYLFKGILVEVGAATPEFLSMSKHFKDAGWRCIGIEPNPKFAEMHRARGNEIYQYAAGNFNADDVDFEVAHFSHDYESHVITDHSYSSLKVKEEYKATEPIFSQFYLNKIKVAVRKLDWILATHCPEVDHIDFLSVDVEGWELEVMGGFDLNRFRPQVVLLENLIKTPEYERYMRSFGYTLDAQVEYNYLFLRSQQPVQAPVTRGG